jgi:UDP-glucose 4-epimerase
MRLAVVTGAAGFIGSHLVDGLLVAGWGVRCIDDLSATGSWSNVSLSPIAEGRWGQVRGLHTVDVRKIDQTFLAGADVVFHLAAMRSVPRSVADPLGSNSVNIDGTLAVLEAARAAGVRRVVFASSSSIYGDQLDSLKTENMNPNPRSPYALQKLTGERYCRLYSELYGLETVCLRFFNVYGPRQDPRSEYAAVIPRFLRAHLTGEGGVVYGDGTQTRDFTYVGDVVAAAIAAAGKRRLGPGRAINVSTGYPTSVRVLWDLTAVAVGFAAPIHQPEFHEARKGDVVHTRGSVLRAYEDLGWAPRMKLEDGGLLETANYIRMRS